MPRRASSLPRYRRHRASGQAVVTLSGRDFYLGRYGTPASRQQYERLVAEWLAAGKTLRAVDARRSLTVVELVAAFWCHAKQYYRDRHGQPTGELHNYKRVLGPLKAKFGRLPVECFGPLSLKTLQEQLITDGLARGTINHHVQRIRNVFRWGVCNELVPASVHEALRTLPGLRRGRTAARETPPVLPVAEEIVAQTLPHL
jgi:hypothetical protein